MVRLDDDFGSAREDVIFMRSAWLDTIDARSVRSPATQVVKTPNNSKNEHCDGYKDANYYCVCGGATRAVVQVVVVATTL